jgi:hypothetical protein
MRRTLLLDEDDLIMVVKEDVVKQIDENRGELNRTEFVNHLIQCQLKEYYNGKDFVAKTEFQNFTNQITELLHDFLQFFVTYGMAMGRGDRSADIQALTDQLEAFRKNHDQEEIDTESW